MILAFKDGVRDIRTIEMISEQKPKTVADLLAIAVLPEWQSRGAGKLLLHGVEAAVKNCAGEAGEASVRLCVAQDNIPARRLFEGCGYRYLPEEQGVYPAGQPSIAMWKRLPDST